MPKIALDIENDRDATFLWEFLNSPEAGCGQRTPVAAWVSLVYERALRPESARTPWRFSFTLDVDAGIPGDRVDKIAMDVAQELVRRMARHTSRLREVAVEGRPVPFEEGSVAAALEAAMTARLRASVAHLNGFAPEAAHAVGNGSPEPDDRRHELSLRAAMDQLLSEGLIAFTVAGDQRLVSRAPRPMSTVDLTMVDLVLQQYRTVRAGK